MRLKSCSQCLADGAPSSSFGVKFLGHETYIVNHPSKRACAFGGVRHRRESKGRTVSARESILAPLQCFSIHHWRLYRAPIDTARARLVFTTRVLIASSDANKPRSKHGKSPLLSPTSKCLVARARQDAGTRIDSLALSGGAIDSAPACNQIRQRLLEYHQELRYLAGCVRVCDSILPPPLAPLSVSIIAIEKLMSGHARRAPLLAINFAK